MQLSDLLFVSSGYSVVALKKSDGSHVWETVLIDKLFKPGLPFVTMVVDETGVYAHVSSDLFRLDWQTGSIIWRIELAPGSWSRMNQIASLAMLGAGTMPTGAAASQARDRQRSD